MLLGENVHEDCLLAWSYIIGALAGTVPSRDHFPREQGRVYKIKGQVVCWARRHSTTCYKQWQQLLRLYTKKGDGSVCSIHNVISLYL